MPPAVASLNVVVEVVQTLSKPKIAGGVGLTVTNAVAVTVPHEAVAIL